MNDLLLRLVKICDECGDNGYAFQADEKRAITEARAALAAVKQSQSEAFFAGAPSPDDAPPRAAAPVDESPYAYAVYLPSADNEEFFHSLDEPFCCDLLTNNDDAKVTPLYESARPAIPAGPQPIATAPRDGTAILLGARCGWWIGKWLPVYTSGFTPACPWSSLMLNHDHITEKWEAPTHWMPLPNKIAAGVANV